MGNSESPRDEEIAKIIRKKRQRSSHSDLPSMANKRPVTRKKTKHRYKVYFAKTIFSLCLIFAFLGLAGVFTFHQLKGKAINNAQITTQLKVHLAHS